MGLDLGCLMTRGLRKDIRCHVWPYFFLNLQIARSDIRPHIKWAVSLVMIAYGHFNLSQGLKWVCMGSHTHLITPKAITEDLRKSDHQLNLELILHSNVINAPRTVRYGWAGQSQYSLQTRGLIRVQPPFSSLTDSCQQWYSTQLLHPYAACLASGRLCMFTVAGCADMRSSRLSMVNYTITSAASKIHFQLGLNPF